MISAKMIIPNNNFFLLSVEKQSFFFFALLQGVGKRVEYFEIINEIFLN